MSVDDKEIDSRIEISEAGEDLPDTVMETQNLIDGGQVPNRRNNISSRVSSRNYASLDDGESRVMAPFLIVLLAFFGVGFYFLKRPKASDWAAAQMKMPPNARDAVAPTILISIDGFRHEYLSRKKKGTNDVGKMLAPHLHSIAKNGTYAVEGMEPVVPTITFPNHWSLVTGLYPENSGIIGNTMYDPVRKSWFHVDRSHPDWWFGSPIWQTVRGTPRQIIYDNGTRTTMSMNYTSACVFWPGSDVKRHAADAFWQYNSTVSLKDRVDRVVALLEGTASDLKRKAQFVTLYFSNVDHAGHEHGPHSLEVTNEIVKVDDAIGYLLSKLGQNASNVYNIVVVSDHGMTDTFENRSIDLAPILKNGTVQDVVTSPMGLFLNLTTPAEEVYSSLKQGLKDHSEHISIYRKEELPERWHLRKSRLVTPIVTMATLGWVAKYPHQHLVPDADKPLERQLSDDSHGDDTGRSTGGTHGYDNTFEDMQAIFIAQGPAFKAGSTLKKMRSIDLYEMLCYIFRAKPSPNNGTLSTTSPTILKTNPAR